MVNLTYLDDVYTVDEEIDIGNLKLFVKKMILENKRLKETNDELVNKINEMNNNSCIMEVSYTDVNKETHSNIWQERYLFANKENNLLIDKNNLLIENNKLLHDKIKYLESGNNKQTYASAVANYASAKPLKEIIPTSIIYSHENNSLKSDEIVSLIKSNIDPIKDNINVKISSNNAIVKIGYHTHEDKTKMQDLLNNRLNNKIIIEDEKLKNPHIKITNITEKYEHNKLVDLIIDQNNLTHDNVKIETKFIKENKKNSETTYTAFIEVELESFNILMEKKKIYIEWSCCPVFEDLNITRCYKCNSYNHKAINCTNDLSRATCSGKHESKSCKSNHVCCTNCKYSNLNYNTNYSIKHRTFDYKKCAYYRTIASKVKKTINYYHG